MAFSISTFNLKKVTTSNLFAFLFGLTASWELWKITVHNFKVRPYHLLLLVLTPWCIQVFFKNFTENYRRSKFFKLLAFSMIGLILHSLFVSEIPKISLAYSLWVCFNFFAVVVSLSSFQYFEFGLLSNVLLNCVILVFQTIFPTPASENPFELLGYSRPYALFGEPGYASVVLAITIFVLLMRKANWAFIGLILTAAFLTYSRLVYLSCGVVFLGWFFKNKADFKKMFVTGLIPLLVAVIIHPAFFGMHKQPSDIAVRRSEEVANPLPTSVRGSEVSRMRATKVALQDFMPYWNPMGIGLFVYFNKIKTLHLYDSAPKDSDRVPHSMPIEIFLELGIAGLLILAALTFYFPRFPNSITLLLLTWTCFLFIDNPAFPSYWFIVIIALHLERSHLAIAKN